MESINEKWVEFLREQYPAGSRIRLRELKEPDQGIEPGSWGSLESIDDTGAFRVKWKDGAVRSLVIGEDSFTVRPPEPHPMKLYMPLTADLWPDDRYADDYPERLNGRELSRYTDGINMALADFRMPEEAERGIMHWYHDDDSVNDKVKSVVFSTELRDGQLWGVADCRVVGDLSTGELAKLKDYISGQASDGWGEGFEEREIEVCSGELYVHLWNWDDWSIRTEAEQFDERPADHRPDANSRPCEQQKQEMGGINLD